MLFYLLFLARLFLCSRAIYIALSNIQMKRIGKGNPADGFNAAIGERTKNLMKEGAILMNFGRGGIVNENAVARAIDGRNLRFASDVLETEPMRADHPLLRIKNKENLILTPHVAWASFEARERLVVMIAENIKEFLKG